MDLLNLIPIFSKLNLDQETVKMLSTLARRALASPDPNQFLKDKLRLVVETSEGWRNVLGFGPDDRPSRSVLDVVYRSAIQKAHPDKGGSTKAAQAVNQALAEAKAELGYE